ncbi:phytase, partial [Salmonella enterica subsp. enterica serovar Agona]|nr:phytase [Salmonella enterica subsp. enterica serovar Agona]
DNCLYLTSDQSLYSFFIGEEGVGEQWMIQSKDSAQITPRFIRKMSLPPNSSFCVVDDHNAKLYINEENVGIWSYEADPEADLIRYPVDLNDPHGSILGNISGLSLIDNALAAIDESKAILYRYSIKGTSWEKLPPVTLQNVDEAERIHLKGNQDQKQLLLVDGEIKMLDLDWTTQK